MKLIKIVLKSILWLALFVISLSIIFVGVFFFNEPLNKDLKIILKDDWIDSGDKEDNAAYYFLGFNAPADKNAFEIGKQLNAIYRNLDSNTDYWMFKTEREKMIPFYNEFPIDNDIEIIFDEFIAEQQIEILKSNEEILHTAKNEVHYLFERLDEIKRTTYYKTPYIPNYGITAPIYMVFIRITQIELALNILEISNDKEAWKRIVSDLKFFHRLLEQSDETILSLVCRNILQFYYKSLDAVISNPDLIEFIPSGILSNKIDLDSISHKIIVKEMFEQYSMMKSKNSMKFDFVLDEFSNCIQHLDVESLNSFWKMLSFNRNGFLNQFYSTLLEYNELILTSSEESILEFENTFQVVQSYNIFYIDLGIIIKHFSKLLDLNGYIDLLNLKLRIKQNNITKTNIQAYISSQSDTFFNPYTNQSLKYNTQKCILYFDGPIFNENGVKYLTREVAFE